MSSQLIMLQSSSNKVQAWWFLCDIVILLSMKYFDNLLLISYHIETNEGFDESYRGNFKEYESSLVIWMDHILLHICKISNNAPVNCDSKRYANSLFGNESNPFSEGHVFMCTLEKCIVMTFVVLWYRFVKYLIFDKCSAS